MEQEKKRRDQRINKYQQSNHEKKQQILRGYKAEFLKSNPEPTLEYSVDNIVANGWLNIEYDEHPLYFLKGESSLSALLLNKKV